MEAKTLAPVTHTGRGFEIIQFNDRYGKACSLQQSSAADYTQPGVSAVWLGVCEERMHLSLEQVEALINHLKQWTETGSFVLPTTEQEGCE